MPTGKNYIINNLSSNKLSGQKKRKKKTPHQMHLTIVITFMNISRSSSGFIPAIFSLLASSNSISEQKYA
jgi:hypothetical protein